MSQAGADADAGAGVLMLRLSVPAQGGLRAVASEVATRIATYLGSALPEAEFAATTLEDLARRVAPGGSEGDITFEFREVDRGLLIQARCDGRSCEARHPLPA
ncbi:MAG TPA: hypothetical protein VFO14_13710 [Vicinamibacterales bacterium]|jgi:hypothetical protein|nr:hypothetical protein [Vicinamibacterales bacterium]